MMNAVVENSQESAGVETWARGLSNDAVIIELLQTLNHLSRWVTPIHDRARLDTSPHRSEQSLKEILIGLRDGEARVYSLMNAIATQVNPDLDRVPPVERTAAQIEADRESNALVVMSGFRRVRQSSTSLLRALPDTAWARGGYSRTRRDWTIRQLAEFLVVNDWQQLAEIDRLLQRSGVRDSIAEVSQVRLEQLDETFVSVAERD